MHFVPRFRLAVAALFALLASPGLAETATDASPSPPARHPLLDARAVDVVCPGEQESEVAHNFRGEKTRSGRFAERAWRDAGDGGWFSYRMKVLAKTPQQLVCTYWGSDAGREFDILIDNQIVATEVLSAKLPGTFLQYLDG